MQSKSLLKIAMVLGAIITPGANLYAKTYLSVEQARHVLFADSAMSKIDVRLTKEQMKSIKKASGVRVNSNKINAHKTSDGGWFILDQVIGKHENIDIAVALNPNGGVRGVEILTYRETYGGQVRNKKWLAQFFGKNYQEKLKLDKQIKNISGATLSCSHLTDGVNRLMHSWDQVLRHL